MRANWIGIRYLVLVAAALSLAFALACTASESEQPAAPAPAAPAATSVAVVAPSGPSAPQQPAAAASAAPAKAPVSPQAAVAANAPSASNAPTGPRTSAPTASTAPTAATNAKYVAPKVKPGGYNTMVYSGPMPTIFRESPMSAALVKQGKILPLEQRIPVASDVHVIPPVEGIGAYGGIVRLTGTGDSSFGWGDDSGFGVDLDRLSRDTHVFKTATLSADGRVYTFTIRKGARWSDGYPYMMEDVRFAFEDFMLNKILMPGLPLQLTAPIAGTDVKFKVVDDVTFTLSYDDPYYGLLDAKDPPIYTGTKGCPRCFQAPAHIWKRYHIKYNPTEIPAFLAKYNQPDWAKLITSMRDQTIVAWVPPAGQTIPTVYDPNYVYKGDFFIPQMKPWLRSQITSAEIKSDRNHYYIGVDPEGNQLPYADGLDAFKVESRDVGAFRAMNGEHDFGGESLLGAEIPLYLTNMDKGDYSLYLWRNPTGGDAVVTVSQDYVADPEIGKLVRTQDFRIALSLAMNRNVINNIMFSGVGTPWNWVPHASTPYYPGDAIAQLHVNTDLAQAKAIMAKIGYKDTDGDGYLNRLDGKGNLEMYFEGAGAFFDVTTLLQDQWGKLGIKLTIKNGDSSGVWAANGGTQYFYFHEALYDVNPWQVSWTRLVPLATSHALSNGMGSYYATRGEKGMAPTGTDPAITDAYGKTAANGTYPIDVSGDLKKMQDLWNTGLGIATLSPKQIDMGKQIYTLSTQQKFNIGTVGFAGHLAGRGLKLGRNNVRNIPRGSWGGSGYTDTFYFEGGIDNMNHQGNKAKAYRSVSFLQPGYWNY